MKKLFPALILAVLLLTGICFAESNVSVTIADKAVVKTKQSGGNYYLILPSGTDTTAVYINGPDGSTLSGSVGTEKLNGYVDLTKVVGDIVAGKMYSATVKGDGSAYKVYITLTSGMRTMFVELEDAERSWLDTSKNNKATSGTIAMTDENGAFEQAVELKSMKARGNSSFNYAKRKSYTVTLKKGAELVDGSGECKKWCLVANDSNHDDHPDWDRTGIDNFAAYEIYRRLGGAYALQNEFIDVYINGEYRGIYMLVPKVTISSSVIDIAEPKVEEDKESVTRVVGTCGLFQNGKTDWDGNFEYDIMGNTVAANVETVMYKTADEDAADPAIAAGIRAYQYSTNSSVTEQGGVIIEIDFRFTDVACWFVTRNGNTFALYEPEYASREQVQEIAIHIQEFEDAVYSLSLYDQYGRYYKDFIDNDSLLNLVITESFIANRDIFKCSTFISCDREDDGSLGILTFGPTWDNDYSGLNNTTICATNDIKKLKSVQSGFPFCPFLKQLMQNTGFLNELKELWDTKLEAIVLDIQESALPEFVSRTSVSRYLTGNISGYGKSVDSMISEKLKGYANRLEVWQNGIWDSKHTTAVYISEEDGKLVATVEGPGKQLSWYEINDDASSTLISSGTSTEFTPPHAGKYVVMVEGSCLLGLYADALYSEVFEYSGS